MKPETYHLFVYGSLRKGFNHPAYQYIANFFTLAGPAKVKGKLFDMGDYPAAVPAMSEDYIIGELYTLNNQDEFGWAIGQIYDYEGVVTELGEIPLYRRATTTVQCNGYTTTAWIYWYNGDTTDHPQIESGDVLKYRDDKLKG